MYTSKTCPRCGETKAVDGGWSRNKAQRDGLAVHCKVCKTTEKRERRRADRAKAAADRHRWNTTPHTRRRRTLYMATNRHRWETNPALLRAAKAATNARRRARIAATAVPFTLDDLGARLSMWSGCWVCGGVPTEVDHVKPLAKGGPHMLANLRPICGTCNATKSSRWPFDPASILVLDHA